MQVRNINYQKIVFVFALLVLIAYFVIVPYLIQTHAEEACTSTPIPTEVVSSPTAGASATPTITNSPQVSSASVIFPQAPPSTGR